MENFSYIKHGRCDKSVEVMTLKHFFMFKLWINASILIEIIFSCFNELGRIYATGFVNLPKLLKNSVCLINCTRFFISILDTKHYY